MATWPDSGEDKQLDRYWKRDDVGGMLYTEVCLGANHWKDRAWEGAAAQRRFDGVIVHGPEYSARFGHTRFQTDVGGLEGVTVDLIEVKKGLGEPFLGQALVGRWMFEQQVAKPYGLKVGKTVALHRHRDPALLWVAAKLGIDAVRDAHTPSTNAPLQNRVKYRLQEPRLRRLKAYRNAEAGLYLTRIPLAGPSCGVEEWGQTEQTWIRFVRVKGRAEADLRVFDEAQHMQYLSDPQTDLELVVVTAKSALGRGPLGVVAAHALMFERQYGRPFSSCAIVCGKGDPAVEAAVSAIGGTRGIPEVTVFATEG